MGDLSVSPSPVLPSTTAVTLPSAPQVPAPASPASLDQIALQKLRENPEPIGDHAQLVSKLFDEIDNSEIRLSLDKATLARALSTGSADSQKVESSERRKLESLCREAERTLKKLDKFTGRELAKTLTGSSLSFASRAVEAAIKAQFSLAAELRAASAQAGGDAQLLALAHEADLRGCEIGRLVNDLYQFATYDESTDRTKDGRSVSDLDKSMLQEKNLLSATTVQRATTALPTQQGMDFVRNQIDPILASLETRLTNLADLDAATIASAKQDLAQIRSRVADARANGIVTGAVGVTVRVDDRVLGALEEKIAALSNRIADFDKSLVRNVAHHYIDELTFPDLTSFHERLLSAGTGLTKEELVQYEEFRHRIHDYIDGRLSLSEVKGQFSHFIKMDMFYRKVATAAKGLQLSDSKADDKLLLKLVLQLQAFRISDDEQMALSGFHYVKAPFDHVFEHLELILKRAADFSSGKIRPQNEDLWRFILDMPGVSKIAEIRAHGFEPEDLDPVSICSTSVTVGPVSKGGDQ